MFDGYDEVSSYLASNSDGLGTQIKKDIFDQQCLLLTSRPNALDINKLNAFRIGEVIGFDVDGIKEYIEKYCIQQQVIMTQALAGATQESFTKVDILTYLNNYSNLSEIPETT